MEALHRETRRVLMEARNQLEALEAASANRALHPAASAGVAAALRGSVAVLSANGGALRRLLGGEAPARREVWHARLADLDDQVRELVGGERRCAERLRATAGEVRLREELLRKRPGGGGDVVLGMGPAGGADEARALGRAASGVRDVLATGRGAMQRLVEQRARLKGARTRMMDVMHRTELGRRVLVRIERHNYEDTLLVYSLMGALLLVLFLAVLWKRS